MKDSSEKQDSYAFNGSLARFLKFSIIWLFFTALIVAGIVFSTKISNGYVKVAILIILSFNLGGFIALGNYLSKEFFRDFFSRKKGESSE